MTENLLLVEVPDDVHVVSQLLNKYGLTRLRNKNDKSIYPLKLFLQNEQVEIPFDIEPIADRGNVTGKFESIVEFSNKPPKRVGLILDFDAPIELQANNRDLAVKNAILRLQSKDSCWNLPKNFSVLSTDGFIAEPANADTPKIGIWLMPNNQERGMLETFLLQIIPNERVNLLNYARQSTETAKQDYQAPYQSCHRDKAVVHTFLSWMDEPGKPFGISFQNGNFDTNTALARRFVEWLKKLFQ